MLGIISEYFSQIVWEDNFWIHHFLFSNDMYRCAKEGCLFLTAFNAQPSLSTYHTFRYVCITPQSLRFWKQSLQILLKKHLKAEVTELNRPSHTGCGMKQRCSPDSPGCSIHRAVQVLCATDIYLFIHLFIYLNFLKTQSFIDIEIFLYERPSLQDLLLCGKI